MHYSILKKKTTSEIILVVNITRNEFMMSLRI